MTTWVFLLVVFNFAIAGANLGLGNYGMALSCAGAALAICFDSICNAIRESSK